MNQGRRAGLAAGLATGLGLSLGTAAHGASEVLDIRPVTVPNYAGVGIGGAPSYLGSDDYRLGAAPFGRYARGERYIDLQGNYVSTNLVDSPRLRIGPAAILRFGRDSVDDRAVNRLPDIDRSLDMGVSVGYVTVSPEDPRDRWSVSADVLQDVTGEHSGFTLSTSLRKWFALPNYAMLGLSAGATYGSGDYMDTYFSVTPAGAAASGLAPFEAHDGLRDVRATAVFVQPLSRKWAVGAGVMYMRLVGDAADTPITDVRGSPNQWLFGLGLARIF